MNAVQGNLFGQPERPKLTPAQALDRCKVIYEPKGRAREYSPLALNVYNGCGHGCVYCYAPSATRKPVEVFHQPKQRAGRFLDKVEADAVLLAGAAESRRVLLSFTCDPYQPLEVRDRVTQRVLRSLKGHGLNVQVLTKGGTRACRDLDLFTSTDAFATTMTLLNEAESLKWEPGAALPADRLKAIAEFHEAGVPTWVSLEPVLDPAAALEIIRRTHPIVDLFKVGRLNYHRHAHTIDWRQFGHNAIALLESLGYREIGADDLLQPGERGYYVKHDLRLAL